MEHKKDKILKIIIPLFIFIFAYALHHYFFAGFILGDDPRDVSEALRNIDGNPDFHDPHQLRFGSWFFIVLSFKLLGISEFSFFIIPGILSASLSVIGYFILTQLKYPRKQALVAALFVASAPFEVLISTVNANDLTLSWLLAIGVLSFLLFERKPILQGSILGIVLWAAFYVKVWAIYFLPPLIAYYFFKYVKTKELRSALSFLITTLILFIITSIILKTKTGTFFHILYYHEETFVFAKNTLVHLFLEYPSLIFIGSEFETTFFGYIPYLLLLLLVAKLLFSQLSISRLPRFDKLDYCLIASYCSFFLLLNFFPTTFKFDHFYSPPRIFRYLAPLSFLITLHTSKLVLDFSKIVFQKKKVLMNCGTSLLFLLMISANIYQANDATSPGRMYRESLLSIVKDVQAQEPPIIITDSWLGFFLRKFYLKKFDNKIPAIFDQKCDVARDYEIGLKEIQPALPNGTILITGLASYVYYGCRACDFRLNLFENPLNSSWHLYKEYNVLSYLSSPEPARLWRWTAQNTTSRPIRQLVSCNN